MDSRRSQIGVVVIGRNEGMRLAACLDSLPPEMAGVVYVDSGSTDESREIARERGAEVVELDASRPFSAARARNAGFYRLLEIAPNTAFAQFVDGDCELVDGWIGSAIAALARDEQIAVVCGRRRERRPDASVYNRLCDLEWDTPIGIAESCGGDAMMRREPFEIIGGFDESLIAGEEPELCLRARREGYVVERIDAEMTQHDAAMERFSQWWTRAVRAGHAFAEVSHTHSQPPWTIWRRETRSAWLWAMLLPLALVCAALFGVEALCLLGLYPLQALRVYLRSIRYGWSRKDTALFALSCAVAKFAHASGALRFHLSRLRGERTGLIEYHGEQGASSKERGSKVVELVNQYPQPSHTFVRREIRGLEEAGFEVLRVSVRPTREELPDPEDRFELERTFDLLGAGVVALASASLWSAARHPLVTLGAGIECLRMARRSDRGLLVHAAYLVEACLLRRWCLTRDVDWVHAHFGTNAASVAMLCRRLGGPPFSFTVHGPEEFDQPRALSLPQKIAASAFTVAISEFGRSQLMRWAETEDWRRLHVVRCGIDVEAVAGCRTAAPKDRRMVCVARLAEQKGLFVLMEALGELSRAGRRFQLRIIGDGPLRGPIERRLSELGLEEDVELLGWLSGDAVMEELQRARGLVLPSFAEGLPVVIMEAQGAGRPVVSTYVAGIPELIESEVNGWLVPAGDASALAGAMRELLDAKPESLDEMGAAGSRRVSERHDARASAARLGGLIRSALAAEAAEAPVTVNPSAAMRMERVDV